MAEPIVERYQRILRADPTSRVFVELARALLERGDAETAADTCARGIEHHPDSVLARILWGKALLALGRPDEAVRRFDEAASVDPATAYAYDLGGEALVRAGLRDQALAFLQRGAAQHPHDSRVQLWLGRAGRIGADTGAERAPGTQSGAEFAPAQTAPGAPPDAAVPPAAPVPVAAPPIPPPLGGARAPGSVAPPPLPGRVARFVAAAPPLPAPPPRPDDAGAPGPSADTADDDWSSLHAALGLEDAPIAAERAAELARADRTAAETLPWDDGSSDGASGIPASTQPPAAAAGAEIPDHVDAALNALAADAGFTAATATPPTSLQGALLDAMAPDTLESSATEHGDADGARATPSSDGRSRPAADVLPTGEADGSAALPDEDAETRLRHDAAAFHDAALAVHGTSPFVEVAAPRDGRVPAGEPGPISSVDVEAEIAHIGEVEELSSEGGAPEHAQGRSDAAAEAILARVGAPTEANELLAGGAEAAASASASDGAMHRDATLPGSAAGSAPVTAPAPSFLRRHAGMFAVIAVVLACSVGVATFLVVRNRQRAADAVLACDAARAGLARDTLGSLRQAARLLDETQRAAPRDPEVGALLTEIQALLAYDFGDGDARGAARAALAAASTGRGTHAARWLVATDAERESAAGSLLTNRNATPLASTVAGQVLVSLGDLEGARASLERAAKERPPMLRAIALLGDLAMAGGDQAAALEHYRAVLRVQPTHPRAALGLSDVSLGTGLDLAAALRTLEGVAADRETAVPLSERLRFDLTLARLLAANGRATEALALVEQAAARLPGRADITATLAEVIAAAGDLDRAIATARRAIEQAPGDARLRELVARLQLRRGRWRELLAASDRDPTRTLRTYRGIARLSLGDIAGARAELEATRRDGKMTPEAAGWAALVEIAAGRTGPVTGVVDALLELPLPHPAALLARARLDMASDRRGSAEHHLREAIGRDPDLVEARVALAELLLVTDRAAEALELMNSTVARAPWRGTGRVALAKALLANGKRSEAVNELATVLANAPDDPPAEAMARQVLGTIPRRGRLRRAATTAETSSATAPAAPSTGAPAPPPQD